MAGETGRQYVWDLPTRLFHWLLVALIGFSWWSAENRYMDWHRLSGTFILGLVIFRILWGLFGTSTSRFGQFIKGPRAIWSYLRPGDLSPRTAPLGHNPLGALSVVALLLLLCVQVVTGLFAVDIDGLESGPLSYLVDFDQGRLAAEIHHVSFTLLQVLVGLHIVAILFYLFVKRRNLTGAMITGSRPAEGEESAALAPKWRLLAAVIVSAALAWWVGNGLAF